MFVLTLSEIIVTARINEANNMTVAVIIILFRFIVQPLELIYKIPLIFYKSALTDGGYVTALLTLKM
jgi:hypothetical protein